MRNKFINNAFRYLITATFLSVIFSLNAYSQNRTIDSLKIDLNREQPDTMKANTLYILAYNYLYQSADTALLYGQELEILAEKINTENFKFKANNAQATAYLYLNKYDSAQFYYERAMELSASSIKNRSSIYTNMGLLFKRKGDYEQAIQYYLEGVNFDKKNSVYYGVFLKLMNIGNVYILFWKTTIKQ